MTVLAKADALRIVSRAYGPLRAELVADHLPDRIDLDDRADAQLLFDLGLTRDGLFSALGAEL